MNTTTSSSENFVPYLSDKNQVHIDFKGGIGPKHASFNIPDVVTETMSRINSSTDAFNKVTSDISNLTADLRNTIASAAQKFLDSTNMLNGAEILEKLISFITMAIAASRTKDLSTRSLIIVSWCSANNMFSKFVLAPILGLFTSIDIAQDLASGQTVEKPIQQGNPDPLPLWKCLVVVMKSFLHIETKEEAPMTEKAAKKLSSHMSALTSVEKLIELITKGLKAAFKALFELVHGYPWALRKSQDLLENVNRTIRAAILFRHIETRDCVEPGMYLLLTQCITRIERVEVSLRPHAKEKLNLRNFEVAANELKQKWNAVRAIFASQNRRRPIWIHLDGPPNQGKSELMQFIYKAFARIALKLNIEKLSTASLVYSYNPNSEYFEKYLGQPIFFIDDLFQLDNADVRAVLADILIHLVTSMPYPLNMAAIEGKGNTYFTSSLIITSGNNSNFKDLKLASPAAFVRRIDFWVRVTRTNSDVSDSEIDPSTWKLAVYPRDVWKKFASRGTPMPPTKPISLDELIKQACELYVSLAEKQDRTDKMAAQYAETLANNFQVADVPMSKLSVASVQKQLDEVVPDPSQITTETVDSLLDTISNEEPQISLIVDEDVSETESTIDDSDIGFTTVKPEKKGFLKMFKKQKKEKATKQMFTFEKKTPKGAAQPTVLLDKSETLKQAKSVFGEFKEYITSIPGLFSNSRDISFTDEATFYTPISEWKLPSVLPVFAAGASLLAVIGIVAAGFIFWRRTHEKPVEQKYENNSKRLKEKGNKKPRAVQVPLSENPVQQSDIACLNVVSALASQNFQIEAFTSNGSYFSQHCQFVFGKVFIATKHFVAITDLPEFAYMVIKFPDGDLVVNKDQFRRWYFEGKDAAAVQVKVPKCPQFKDLSHHFVNTTEDLENAQTAPVFMLREPRETAPIVLTADRIEYVESIESYDRQDSTEYDEFNSLFRISGRSQSTEVGECGLPFVTKSNRSPRRALGFLCAGSFSFSYCQIILKSEIDAVKKASEYTTPQMKIKSMVPPQLNPYPLPTSPVPRVPSESEIIPSLVHKQVSDLYRAPAHLKPFRDSKGEYVQPAAKAILKAIKPDVKMSPEDKALYMECMQVAFEEQILPPAVPVCALKLEDALNVPPGYHLVSPIYIDTSAGYHSDQDYSGFTRTGSDKRDFITVDQNGHRSPTPLLLKLVRRLLDIALGKIPRGDYQTYVVDWLKDELRTLDRVEAGKTRLFSGMQVEFLALSRALFLDMIESELANHNNPNSTSAYGLNPESCEWLDFKNQLCPKDDPAAIAHVVAEDISAQDASTSSDMSDCLNKVENAYYRKYESDEVVEIIPGYFLTKEERLQVRQWLNEEIYFNRVHIFFGECYRPGHGNPSGQIKTTPSNTKQTRASSLFSAVKYAKHKKVYLTVRQVAAMLRGKAFGDDHVWSVLLLLREIGFGNGPLKHFMHLIGYEITDFKKNDFEIDPDTLMPIDIPNWYSLTDVEFLKRSFRIINSSCYAPLRKDVIEDTTNWITKGRDPKRATLEVCNAALMSAYHHGKSYFEDLKNRINIALIQSDLPEITLDFETLYAHFHKIATNLKVPNLGLPGFEEKIVQQGKTHKGTNTRQPAQSSIANAMMYASARPFVPSSNVHTIPPVRERRSIPAVYRPSEEEFPPLSRSDEQKETPIADKFFQDNFSTTSEDLSEDYLSVSDEEAIAELTKDCSELLERLSTNTVRRDHFPAHTYSILLPNLYILRVYTTEQDILQYLTRVSVAEWFNKDPQRINTRPIANDDINGVLGMIYVGSRLVPSVSLFSCTRHPGCHFQIHKVRDLNWFRYFPVDTFPCPDFLKDASHYDRSKDLYGLSPSVPVSMPTYINDLQAITDRARIDRPKYDFKKIGPEHSARYICTVSVAGQAFVSDTFTKKIDAKQQAAKHAVDFFSKPVKQMATSKREQKEKSEEGVISGVTTATARLGHKLASFPIIGGVASSAAQVLDSVTPLLRQLGLDYPASTESTAPLVVRQTSSLAHVRGLDSVEVLSADPTNQVTNNLNFFCEHVPASVFANYKLRPGLTRVNSFDGTWTQNQVIDQFPIAPTFTQEVASNFYAILPLGNYASFFRYWRGGIKYKIVFTTSKYVSCRVRIEWHPDPSTIAIFNNDNSGDIVSLTVDVCGDSDVCFTVPYLKDTHWLPVSDPDFLINGTPSNIVTLCNGYLALRVVIPPVVSNSESDTTVDFAVFMSGAEDFVCARPTERWSNFSYATVFGGAEKPIKQMSSKTAATLQDEFRSTFKPIVPASFLMEGNLLQGESINTFPELFHRYTSVGSLSTGSDTVTNIPVNPWIPNTAVVDNTTMWSQFQNSFLFHRGNFRVKLLITDDNRSEWTIGNDVNDPLGQADPHDDALGVRRGITWTSSDFRRIVEAEIPFYGIYPFASGMSILDRFELPCAEIIATSATATSKSARLLLATGDNYSCGQVCAPGYWVLEALDPNNNTTTPQSEKPLKQMSRQEGHGNTDRQVVETTVQESDQLTSFRDQVGIKEDQLALTTPAHFSTDPYADQGLTQVLSRPYLTHSFTWSGTAIVGQLLHKLSYPIDLFTIPNITEKLNRFQYFRSPVHIEVRLNSTTFHSGKLMIVKAPHWNATSSSNNLMPNDDIFSQSCLDTILLSANANETVSFDIPYITPASYLDLQLDTSISTSGEGFFGTVKLYVLAPLRLTGSTSTPSITVTVYSSFAKPEVAGFTTKSIAMSKKIISAAPKPKMPVSQHRNKK